jgi:hypothetical protein
MTTNNRSGEARNTDCGMLETPKLGEDSIVGADALTIAVPTSTSHYDLGDWEEP